MFLPVVIREIHIFLSGASLETTVVALARLEQFYVESGRQEWSGQPAPWNDLADTLSGQRERLKELLDTLNIPPRILRLPQQFNPSADVDGIEKSLHEAEKEVHEWQRRRHEQHSELEQLGRLSRQLELLTPLNARLEEIRKGERLSWMLGRLPAENLENLQARISGLPFVIIPLAVNDGFALLAAVTDRSSARLLEPALQGIMVERVPVPEEFEGVPSVVLRQVRDQLWLAQVRLSQIENEGRRIEQKWRRRLLALWTQASNNWRIAQVITRFDHHGDLYLISGWVPERSLDEVITTVEHTTAGQADIEILEPDVEGPRQAPTLLRNPRILRPFHTLVTTYGFPKYNEIDPTPVVALTYVVMYGIMFGDAGQGALLAIVGLIVFNSTTGTMRALAAVIIAAGLSGAFFGFLYGDLFGFEAFLPTLWLKPMRSVMQLLLISVAGGIVFLNVGFLLFLIQKLRTRHWGQFLFGHNGLAGLWLYWALLWGGYAAISGAAPFSLVVALSVVPALLLFFGHPLSRIVNGQRPIVEESWGSFGVQAFFELFETVIALVSNTISFVRLGAFAIAHAGFESIVVELASTTSGVPYWLIMVAGTALIVALEGLVVGLQAIRLEYYEFFSKFFTGEGRPFLALRLFDADERQTT